MSEPIPDRCPVHGRDAPGWEWPCPLADEPCPAFLEEMERRIADVQAGNFWRLEHLADGTWLSHQHVNGQKTGVVRRFPRGDDGDSTLGDHDE